jgi:hypothetical protein
VAKKQGEPKRPEVIVPCRGVAIVQYADYDQNQPEYHKKNPEPVAFSALS